ncbi:MAG: DUF4097 family beta strand repeat-containing protein [Candidatus Sericytochromatia bacterium]
MSEERKLILQMLHEHRISVDEADRLLAALAGAARPAAEPPPPREAPPAESRPGAEPRSEARPEPQDNLFTKAGPRMEQMMGTLSSLMDSMGQQFGPGLEKRLEGLFNAQRGASGTSSTPDKAPPPMSSEPATLPIPEGCHTLACQHPWGDLHVEGYEGREIQVVVEKHIAQLDDRLRLDDLQLVTRRQGDTLRLILEGTEALRQADRNAVHLRLKVPTGYHLDLQTEKHDIGLRQFSHPEGQAQLKSLSGDLHLAQVALKRIQLQTQSGDVSAEQDSESLTIETQSGDIVVKGSVFDGQLTSQSGQIKLEAAVRHQLRAESRSGDVSLQLLDGAGHMHLHTQSGDIDLSGELRASAHAQSLSGDLQADVVITALAQLDLHTQSGDIDLALRPGSQGHLEAEARAGDITCRHALQQVETGEHRLQGVLGNGEGRLRLSTQTGDILIS